MNSRAIAKHRDTDDNRVNNEAADTLAWVTMMGHMCDIIVNEDSSHSYDDACVDNELTNDSED